MTIKFFVRPPEANNEALEKLFANIDFIESNRELILSTPEFYGIRISGTGIYPIYTAHLPLLLGDLLILWQQTLWKTKDAYAFHIVGSPLSGSNSCRIWSKKKGFQYTHMPSMMAMMRPAFLLVQTGKTERDGNTLSAEIPLRPSSTLTIDDLITCLKEN